MIYGYGMGVKADVFWIPSWPFSPTASILLPWIGISLDLGTIAVDRAFRSAL